MPEAIFNFEDGSVVEIEKVGGGTIGKSYTGEKWFYRFTTADNDVTEGTEWATALHVGGSATHLEAAYVVHDFLTRVDDE